ncbi:hypothetical protein AB0C21_25695 [Spirillospora sp. NPDC049024]
MTGGHAHYVIVDRTGHRVWSRHRGAYTLWHDVLAGPERTVEFVRAQDGGTPDFWMNSVWWNGVLMLDLRHRRMLVHIFDDLRDPDVVALRAWLGIVRALWPGWDVTWATRSLHEVMEYLGLPYDTVLYLDDPPHPPGEQWGWPPEDDEEPSTRPETLIAVRDATGALALNGDWALRLSDYLLAGPDVLLLPQEAATRSAALGAVPNSGLYLDAVKRRADWWSTDLPLDPRRLPALWQGWTLTDHGDAYEDVAALVGPNLLLEPASDPVGALLAWLERGVNDPALLERVRKGAGKAS